MEDINIKLKSRDINNIITLEYLCDDLFVLKMKNYNYEVNYRVSKNEEKVGHYNFIDPYGGPMLSIGTEINYTNSSLKKEEKMIIKDIFQSKHFGIIIDCKYQTD